MAHNEGDGACEGDSMHEAMVAVREAAGTREMAMHKGDSMHEGQQWGMREMMGCKGNDRP